jgi:cyclase
MLGMAKPDTRLVPGVGPLQTRADLQAQHDMLDTMLDRFKKMMKQGLGPEDIIAAAPTKEFDEKWGNPDLFVSTAYRSMWLHVRELGGIV